MALRALGESPEPFLTRLGRQRRKDGRIGSLVNSTIWGVLALPRGEAAGRPLPAPAPAPIRRLVVGSERRAGLERHRRGDPGPPLERRPRPADPAWTGVHPQPHGSKRRRSAGRRAGAGRPVDGVGDPGVPRGRREASGSRLRVSRVAPPAGRELPLQQALRGHAGDRHRAGAPGPQPEAVSAALTQSGSGRHSRPSATSSSTSVLRYSQLQLNQRETWRSGVTTAARTAATVRSSRPPRVRGLGVDLVPAGELRRVRMGPLGRRRHGERAADERRRTAQAGS